MAQEKNRILKSSFDRAWGEILQDYQIERDLALRALEASRAGRVSPAAQDMVRYIESEEFLDADESKDIFWALVMLGGRINSPAFSGEEKTLVCMAVLQNEKLLPLLDGYRPNTGFFADVWLSYYSFLPDKERGRACAQKMLCDQEALVSLGRQNGHTLTKVVLGLIKELPEMEQDAARLKIIENTELLTSMHFFQRSLIIDGLLHNFSDREEASHQAFRLLAERLEVLQALYTADSEYAFYQVTTHNHNPCALELALINRLSQDHAIQLLKTDVFNDPNSVLGKCPKNSEAEELLICIAGSERGADGFHQRRNQEFEERVRLERLSRHEPRSGSASSGLRYG